MGVRRMTTGAAQSIEHTSKVVPRRVSIFADKNVLLVASGGALLLAGWLVHLSGGPEWVRFALLAASCVLSSTETFPEAVNALRRLKLDVDVLMFAAAAGAASLGHYEEAALLLFLFGAGAAGEHVAMSRARSAIRQLTDLTPATAARVGQNGAEETVEVGLLKPDDRIVVRPFDRIPADAMVLTGNSTADESALTGESIPVDKTAGSKVFAGTMNGHGRLTCRVLRVAADTTLARIVRLVEEAQNAKSSTQLFTDRIEAYYVPLVFVLTLGLIVGQPLLGGQTWGVSFYRAMAFLTAASPCALAIGTPAAVLCGIARAARLGVIIKGGLHLEQLAGVKAVAFDKTGTLTSGKLRVEGVICAADGVSDGELLAIAAAAESHATHPIAYAIAAAAREQSLEVPAAVEVEQMVGSGVSAVIEVAGTRQTIYAGKLSDEQRGVIRQSRASADFARAESAGCALVGISLDGRLLGVVALADSARPAARTTIAALHAMNIGPSIILTGDHQAAATHIARQVGIDEARWGLLPAEKLEALAALARAHGSVAMVGDGVNDAPALAAATVGIAVGSGSDVALETADVVLVGSDISRLPTAIALARGARRIVRQNLVIALGVIVVVAPLAAMGYAKLGLAVLLHEGSTVVVVLNSLRLLRWRASTTEVQQTQAGE